mmetsp:Transcript_9833/g.24211  ORF Transcript_9833/g.24211 Transcript_9833/m.24211 type:complete len:214 (-) Transcript_9833:1322-1963(-)
MQSSSISSALSLALLASRRPIRRGSPTSSACSRLFSSSSSAFPFFSCAPLAGYTMGARAITRCTKRRSRSSSEPSSFTPSLSIRRAANGPFRHSTASESPPVGETCLSRSSLSHAPTTPLARPSGLGSFLLSCGRSASPAPSGMSPESTRFQNSSAKRKSARSSRSWCGDTETRPRVRIARSCRRLFPQAPVPLLRPGKWTCPSSSKPSVGTA